MMKKVIKAKRWGRRDAKREERVQKPGGENKVGLFAEQVDYPCGWIPSEQSKDVKFPRQMGPWRPQFGSWVLSATGRH